MKAGTIYDREARIYERHGAGKELADKMAIVFGGASYASSVSFRNLSDKFRACDTPICSAGLQNIDDLFYLSLLAGEQRLAKRCIRAINAYASGHSGQDNLIGNRRLIDANLPLVQKVLFESEGDINGLRAQYKRRPLEKHFEGCDFYKKDLREGRMQISLWPAFSYGGQLALTDLHNDCTVIIAIPAAKDPIGLRVDKIALMQTEKLRKLGYHAASTAPNVSAVLHLDKFDSKKDRYEGATPQSDFAFFLDYLASVNGLFFRDVHDSDFHTHRFSSQVKNEMGFFEPKARFKRRATKNFDSWDLGFIESRVSELTPSLIERLRAEEFP